MSPIRIVYFGTPAYAVPCLQRLAADPAFAVALVVTQPDRPAGRGRQLTPPPVKDAALALGLPVWQPESLRTPDARQPLVDAGADVFVVAAYGQVFGGKSLAIPRRGTVNLHASILPAYRGASPISAAILAGDAETGVSLMLVEKGLDAGAVISVARTPITGEDTTERLTARLADLGADLAARDIPRWLEGALAPQEQDATQATYARPLLKADGWLDWGTSAAENERLVRAMWPWPRAMATCASGTLQVHAASVVAHPGGAAGSVSVVGGRPVVACAEGGLRLDRVQFPGGGPLDGAAAVAGRKLVAGEALGSEAQPAEAPVVPIPATASGSATSA
jgi:methionyl-tRNA formyltransferase